MPTKPLPKGQRERSTFVRFGLTPFAKRFPAITDRIAITVSGLMAQPIEIDAAALNTLERIEQTCDFHCVTTWSYRNLLWSGFAFKQVYDKLIAPKIIPNADVQLMIVKGQDGARTTLQLEDALAADVILADRLNGEPLGIDHGAPVRLVSPAQYGYKSVKYVHKIELCADDATFRPAAFRFMDHPRARVADEERGRVFPGWLLRYLYRPLIAPTVRLFERTLRRHLSERS